MKMKAAKNRTCTVLCTAELSLRAMKRLLSQVSRQVILFGDGNPNPQFQYRIRIPDSNFFSQHKYSAKESGIRIRRFFFRIAIPAWKSLMNAAAAETCSINDHIYPPPHILLQILTKGRYCVM